VLEKQKEHSAIRDKHSKKEGFRVKRKDLPWQVSTVRREEDSSTESTKCKAAFRKIREDLRVKRKTGQQSRREKIERLIDVKTPYMASLQNHSNIVKIRPG